MILFPAIDLKDGACVRLRQGDMAQATVFNNDPVAQARVFERDGFEWLHLVDLNGAFAGHSVNATAIRAIRAAVSIPIELGGGIRDMTAVGYWLESGIDRVILGTTAVNDPAFVKETARRCPGQIAVGIDAREDKVAVQGWASTSTLTASELAKRFEDSGVAAIIFTDISRDGMMKGVNAKATAALAREVTIPVIASGGITGIEDIQKLANAGVDIAGAVIGRALYDGRIDPRLALAAASGKAGH